MDEDLQLLYRIKEQFSEITHKRSYQSLNHVYTFRNGVSEGVPSGKDGTIQIEGMEESVDYTLDKVRGNPLLRMSHSFDEIEQALNGKERITI